MANKADELSDKLGSLLKQFETLDDEGKKFEEDVRQTYKNLNKITKILRETSSPIRGGLIGQIMANMDDNKKIKVTGGSNS